MGAWGTGLYSCDIAEDLKILCQDVYAVYDIGTIAIWRFCVSEL